MSDKTKIEWTDATVNVINGCDVVSPGCKHCYAMKQAHRFPVRQGLTKPTAGGMVWTGEVRFHDPALEQVLRWQRPRRIFWNAHGDTFHEKVPDAWIDRCFAVMALTPQHTHQVLTKRPERMRDYCSRPERAQLTYRAADSLACVLNLSEAHPSDQYLRAGPDAAIWPLPNVWLGTSVEDQKRADERIPILLDTPAAVRWISAEPLLGPVDLTEIEHAPAHCLHALWGLKAETDGTAHYGPKLDWVVVGGESGPGSRPMHPDWALRIMRQCEAAGTAFHFKQWGDWREFDTNDVLNRCAPELGNQTMPRSTCEFADPDRREGRAVNMWRIGKKEAGRMLDERWHNGYPG